MRDMIIRPVRKEEVPVIAQVEGICFPSAEAADKGTFERRFSAFGDCFLAAEWEGRIIGFIDGCATDAPFLEDELYHDETLHKPEGAYQTVFGLAVLPEYQRKGVASKLMRAFIRMARERGRKGIILTCKDRLIPFYESLGYTHHGVSISTHGDAVWNDMKIEF